MMDPLTPEKPKKQSHREDEEKWNVSLCSQLFPISELTKPTDEQSLHILQKAGSTHNIHPILNLQEEEYTDKLYYHRKGHTTFTQKKILHRLARDEQLQHTRTETRKSTRDPAPSSSGALEEVCIFCNKKHKYPKGSKSKEPLSLSQEFHSDGKIR